MFGMFKNSLFGNTEETEYKLLSSETKVSSVCAQTKLSRSHMLCSCDFLPLRLYPWLYARVQLRLRTAILSDYKSASFPPLVPWVFHLLLNSVQVVLLDLRLKLPRWLACCCRPNSLTVTYEDACWSTAWGIKCKPAPGSPPTNKAEIIEDGDA